MKQNCNKCGSDIEEGSAFCSECGTQAEALCSECGTKLEDSAFCPECGTPVNGASPASAPSAPPKSIPLVSEFIQNSDCTGLSFDDFLMEYKNYKVNKYSDPSIKIEYKELRQLKMHYLLEGK